MLLAASLSAEAQTQRYETEFARPLNEVLTDIQNRFGVRLKYDTDPGGEIASRRSLRSERINADRSKHRKNGRKFHRYHDRYGETEGRFPEYG